MNGSGITIGSGSNVVSLTTGGLNNGGNKITNVAAGTSDTDAVNVGQLNKVSSQVTYNTMQINNNTTQINNNTYNIQQNTKRINRVGALSAAMGSLHTYYGYNDKDKGQVMMGVGGYHGERALAVGYAYAPNHDLMLNGSMAITSKKDSMYGFGATWRIGVSPAAPQGFVPIDTVNELKKRIDKLEAEGKAKDKQHAEEIKQLQQQTSQQQVAQESAQNKALEDKVTTLQSQLEVKNRELEAKDKAMEEQMKWMQEQINELKNKK